MIYFLNTHYPSASQADDKHYGAKERRDMKVMESPENYLETILVLHNRLPQVRSIDIVNELGFSKPSISVAMKNLREKGLILMDKDGHITLTDSGRQIAEMIYERHTLLTKWLTALGVDEKIAAEDACRIEHVISQESFEMLKKHIREHTTPSV